MSQPSQQNNSFPRYRVDDLDVDTGKAVVTRNGVELPLPKLSFDLLRALIESAPAVATTDSLLDRVWPGLVVNPETVAARVKLLRDVIGDDPKQPRYILGVRARGYRLIPPVERLVDPVSVEQSPPSFAPSSFPPHTRSKRPCHRLRSIARGPCWPAPLPPTNLRTTAYRRSPRSEPWAPTRVPNILNPRFHGVQTPWNRAFITRR